MGCISINRTMWKFNPKLVGFWISRVFLHSPKVRSKLCHKMFSEKNWMFQNMWESLGLHQWSVDVYCMIEMVYTDRFKGENDGKTGFAVFPRALFWYKPLYGGFRYVWLLKRIFRGWNHQPVSHQLCLLLILNGKTNFNSVGVPLGNCLYMI